MHHPVLGVLRNIGYPARFEGITQTYRAAPLLGEHTSDVLAEFGEA
jgi:formyl-CoA transferase